MWIEPLCRPRKRPISGLASVLLLLLVSGCADEAEEEAGSAPAAVEGVGREQLEAQAEPMTLEEAESLGIVDTTISLGDPANPDSVLPPAGRAVIPIDTATATGAAPP